MLNKILLLNKKPKKTNTILIVFISITLTSILLSYKIETYDSYPLTGIMTCESKCKIEITLQYNKIEILSLIPKIEYLEKEYMIENINYKEPYLNNGIPYQDIELTTNIKSASKIINFKILYNKQRIITKIKKLIIEGE